MSATICACGHHVSAHTHVPAHAEAAGAYCRACACIAFTPRLIRTASAAVIQPPVVPAQGLEPRGCPTPGACSCPPALCPTHQVPLVSFCPTCRGAAGGRSTSPTKAKATRANLEKARAARHPAKSSP